MSFPFYIARRYILSKKSHHAINIITGISVGGVAIATAAMICILSVFNGFQDMVAQLFTDFDPQIKVTPAEGKYMAADEKELMLLKRDPGIKVYTETIEDNALLMLGKHQTMVTIKGVDDNFQQLTNIKDILHGSGAFQLHIDVIDYGIPGKGVLSRLGLPDAEFDVPMQIYAPMKGERIDMVTPEESFNQEELYSAKLAFQVKQGKYDANYVITSLSFARKLFERQGYITAVELRVNPGTDINQMKASIKRKLGDKYVVKDRYEQQEDTFKIMKIEKLISYIFLTFILMIACFNVVGSLSMLIIDKRDDIHTLHNLGATDKQISNIFMLEGRLISVLGAIIGIVIGLALTWLQGTYGLIRFGSENSENFIINAYPVSVHFWDVVLVFLTVVAVGFIAVWYPVKRLSRIKNEKS